MAWALIKIAASRLYGKTRQQLYPGEAPGWSGGTAGRDSGHLPSRTDHPLGPMVGSRIRDIIAPIIENLGFRIQVQN